MVPRKCSKAPTRPGQSQWFWGCSAYPLCTETNNNAVGKKHRRQANAAKRLAAESRAETQKDYEKQYKTRIE